MIILRSVLLFVAAGVCEIGGGYLIWLWLRGGKSAWLILPAAAILLLYGVIPTFQNAEFGRVYAAYGGVFVVLSVIWGWGIDGIRPDRYDLLGTLIVVAGVIVIFYSPRK